MRIAIIVTIGYVCGSVPFAYLLSVGALEWAPVRDVIQRLPGPLMRTREAVYDPTRAPSDAEEEAA